MEAHKVASFIWFESKAAEAVKLYASIFGDHCRVSGTSFELFGQRFIAFDGGPMFRLNEAFSIMVECEDQAEIDRYWNAFLEKGGTASRCGWLKDAHGLSWQIIPKQLFSLLHHPDPAKAKRVLDAMLGMQKLDLAKLESA